jgi:hypothetical protein
VRSYGFTKSVGFSGMLLEHASLKDLFEFEDPNKPTRLRLKKRGMRTKGLHDTHVRPGGTGFVRGFNRECRETMEECCLYVPSLGPGRPLYSISMASELLPSAAQDLSWHDSRVHRRGWSMDCQLRPASQVRGWAE